MADLGITFENQKYNKSLLSNKEGNDLIGEFLKSNHPFLASKVPNLVCYMAHYFLEKNEPMPNYLKNQALANMGIYPNDQKSLEKFVLDYIENLKDVNVMGVWAVRDYDWFINTYCPLAHYVKLHALEPFNFYGNPWSAHLANKKILVIHPFETSIINNYKNRDKLFVGTNVLPEFELKTIKAEQNLSNINSNYFDSIERTKNKILDIDDFDVAIVGCGASGLPISAFIKRELKKTVIHMGGVTQILFGIMGRRWDLYTPEQFVFKKFINEYWTRPLPEETPESYKLVEGGCYW